jgi:hypothetical protein
MGSQEDACGFCVEYNQSAYPRLAGHSAVDSNQVGSYPCFTRLFGCDLMRVYRWNNSIQQLRAAKQSLEEKTINMFELEQ